MYKHNFTIYDIYSSAQYLWEKMTTYEVETEEANYFEIEKMVNNMVEEIQDNSDYGEYYDNEDGFFATIEDKLTEVFGREHWDYGRLSFITGNYADL